MNYLHWPNIFNEDGTLVTNYDQLYPPIYLPVKDGLHTDDSSGKNDNLAGSLEISFFAPRENQRTIAPGRDFYITGAITCDFVLPDDTYMEVDLKKKDTNEIVRSITCRKKDDKEHIYLNNRNVARSVFLAPGSEVLDEYVEIARNSCIPDLVYDKRDDNVVKYGDTIPESLRWTWNKAYYTDTFFSALVYGGEYGKDENSDPLIWAYDQYGQELKTLEIGDYSVAVSFSSKSKSIVYGSKTLDIRIDYLKNVMLATFSNNDHILRMRELDGPNDGEHVTLLWDPFPGVWGRPLVTFSDAKMRLGETTPEYFFFQTNRARTNYNDSCEYRGPKSFFIDFEARPVSNALIVEIAEIIRQRKLGKKIEIESTYYDAGEPYGEGMPTIPPDDALQKAKGRMCNLLNFRPGSKIAFTCVELSNKPLSENDGNEKINLADVNRYPYHLFVDTRFKPNVEVHEGDYIRISGVCLLPDDQNPQQRNADGAFTDLKYFTNVVYKITNRLNGETRTIKKSIGILDNRYTDKDGKSGRKFCRILEFKHVFQLPEGWTGIDINIQKLLSDGGGIRIAEYVLGVDVD